MSVNINFFKPFIKGTLTTLEVQSKVKAEASKPYAKGEQPDPNISIAGVISLNSNAFNGSIALCFPQNVFLHIMSNMLGETFTELTPDLEDGAAELLNIIFGQAKTVLTNDGYTIAKAIPTVIRGDNLSIQHKTKAQTIVLPFVTEVGNFYIEIAFEPAE